jgi:hypothetical protein
MHSIIEAVGTGAPQLVSVPEYIDRSHIYVYVDNALTASFSWINTNTISITATAGKTIRVQRQSSPAARLVSYGDGAQLPGALLDIDSKQAFFMAQEAADIAALQATGGVLLLPSVDPAALADFVDATKGAGQLGYSTALPYATGTVGSELRKIGTKNLGALPAGTTADVNPDKTFSGHSGGTTDFRGWVDKVTAGGANPIAQVNARNIQLELTSTGAVTSSFGQQAYIRAGLGGSGAVNVTSMRVYDTHVANEGTGAVANATCYFADGVDLLDGTGVIQQMIAFYAGDQGHATRVTQKAVGFRAGNMTAGAPFTAGFHSEMQDGTNKWAFYSEGNAPSLFTGKVGFGSATRPVDGLELFQGYAKLCGSTTKLADGSYHEMRSANGTYLAKFTNSHASTPDGIHLKFTNANPNNTAQLFLLCDDAAAERLKIFSNGNVVNAGNSYGAISDARLKRDIRDAGAQWDDIKAVRFRKYRLIADGDEAKEQLGVIAQELEEVSPGLVSQDADGMLSVNYSVLYLKAVKALQEVMARVEALEAQLKLTSAGQS